MRIFNRIIIFLTICSCFFTQSSPCLYGVEDEEERLIYQEDLKKGKTEMHLDLVRLDAQKIGAIIEVAKKSDAKIQSVSIESPSGKTYKAEDIRPMPWGRLKGFLDTVSSYSGDIIQEIVRPVDRRNIGRMGVTRGAGEVEFDSTGIDIWVTVCTFAVEEEPGEWGITIKYYDEGKRGKVKARFRVR